MHTAPAAAQNGQDELARTHLLEQAETAYEHGDHATALDFARRASEIRTTPSVLLMLAQEHNALGHTLDALAAAERCLHDLEADRHVPHYRRMLGLAEQLRDSLRTRVGYVTVNVPTPAPTGLQVRVQGGELVPALWNVPYPALPGTVTIEASGPAGVFRRELTLDAGHTETVTVALTTPPVVAPPRPVVETAPATVSQAASVTVIRSAPARQDPPVHEPSARRGPGAGPWVVVGAGAAALGASLVFFLLRNGAIDDRNAACPNATCSESDYATAQGHHDTAVTYNTVSSITLGVGAAAVAGGVVWYLLARPGRAAPTRAALRWYVMPTFGGASLGVGGSL